MAKFRRPSKHRYWDQARRSTTGELQRGKISEALLPPDSVVQFRQPTIWQTYRWQILLLTAAILVQAAMIMVLLYEHRRRRVAEVAARTSMSELMHLNRIVTAGVVNQ